MSRYGPMSGYVKRPMPFCQDCRRSRLLHFPIHVLSHRPLHEANPGLKFRTMLRLMFHEITTPEANTMGFGDTFDVPGQSGLDTPSITENSDTARNTGRIHRSRGKMDIMNLIDLTAESSPSKQKGKQKEEPQQPGPRDHFAQDSSAIGTLAKEQDQDQGGFAFNNVGVGKMAAAIEMAELLELELDLVLGVIDSDWQV